MMFIYPHINSPPTPPRTHPPFRAATTQSSYLFLIKEKKIIEFKRNFDTSYLISLEETLISIKTSGGTSCPTAGSIKARVNNLVHYNLD